MLDSHSTLSSCLRLFLVPSVLLIGVPVHAIEPAWWTQVGADGQKVINSTVTNADPKGVANIGQAKYMAKRALEAIRLLMPETADGIEAQLVGAGKIIPTWDPPAASSPLAKAQFAPLLIGQLKAIADPFYTALRDTDSEWVLAQLAENGTMDLANPDNFFPWTSDGADNADKAIATIGQLKAVFSLRFESIPLTLDAEDAGVNDQDVITGVVERTPQASPPNYEIQFRKGNKFQKKFGYAPWEPTPTNISTRYLTKYLSTGATANDINRTRLSGSDWQIGFTNQISAQRVIWFTAADHGRKNSYNILSGEENIGAGYLPYSVYYTWDWNLATWRGKWYFDESYSYDFPPYNLNWDAPARVFYEESLADENTIEMVKQTALDNPPAYPSGWTNGKPWATWDISDDDLGVTYSRFIFRFKKRDVNTDSPPVSAGVYFMPKGSSAQQLLKTISWNGKTAKSADCFVDPKALRRGLDGDFHIGFSSIRFELDVAQQDQREAGETVVIPANDTDSGGGNAPDKASPVARFPGMDDSWYTGGNITLTKMSGAGEVRFKVGTTEVPLGTNLAPAYFKSGGQFKGGKWKIEGVTAGPVKMILAYTKGNTTMSATRTATVIRGDLDMDSDNSGAIALTDAGKIAEENIENDPALPGKVIAVRPDFLNDPDGVPNSADGLAELRINASGFKSSDLIKLSYGGSNPAGTQSSTTDGVTTYQNAAGALRIWKKPTGGGPPVVSGYVAPSASYTLSNLGIVPGTETFFYVQGVNSSPTKSDIKVKMSSGGVVIEDTVTVSLVIPKIEWISAADYNNLDAHIDPWTNVQNGMRIFPDSPNPGVDVYRDIVIVKVSGPPNSPFWLRSFDVDDTTLESFDTNRGAHPAVIDPDGTDGMDNGTDGSRGIQGVGKQGIFMGSNAIPFGKYAGTLDQSGSAQVQFMVGTSPGNNYRVAASFSNKDELDPLHTTVALGGPATLVSPDSSQSPLFGGVVTPMLTTWRHLWLEVDTMKSQSTPPAGEENWITGNVASIATGTNPIPVPTPYWDCTFLGSINRSLDEYENGWLINGTTHIAVPVIKVFQSASGGVVIRTLTNPGPTGAYTLLDDDNTFLPAAYDPILPFNVVDYPYLAAKFSVAFIELVPAGRYNDRSLLNFDLNKNVLSPEWNNTMDLIDRRSVWTAMAVLGYQPLNEVGMANEDKDPNTEGSTGGNTVLFTGCSSVYLEVLRDELDGVLRSSNMPATQKEYLFHNSVNLTIAHEIGHQPSVLYNGDHGEGGIMTAGGGNGEDLEFDPTTVARFRRTQRWSVGIAE